MVYARLALSLVIVVGLSGLIADGRRFGTGETGTINGDDAGSGDPPEADIDRNNGVDPETVTIRGDNGEETDPTREGARAGQTSLEWMEDLKKQEKADLINSVGPEVYDEGCTEFIAETLLGPSHPDGAVGDTDWWLKAIDKDPLIKGYQDRKKNEEIDRDYERLVAEADATSLSFWGRFKNWIWKAWANLKIAWQKTKNYFKSTKLFGEGGVIAKYREEVDKITNRKPDRDGKMATVCSLDGATLKLLPFSRAYHYELEQNDHDHKCARRGMPNSGDKMKLGWMDPDRVIRSTQMAIYQECYHKCVHYVVQNMEKVSGLDGSGTDPKFCSLPYEEQEKSLRGDALSKFLVSLMGSKESDVYMQCQKLLLEGDMGPELFDFAIERSCTESRPWARPTNLYSPSESAPITLYKDPTEINQPVCKAGVHNEYAGSEDGRSCPEGTHCLCQRAAQDAHASVDKDKRGKSLSGKLFDFSGRDHCSARRPTGAASLTWIDPVEVANSKWENQVGSSVEKRAGKGKLFLGIGFLLAGATWGAVMGIGHSVIGTALASAWTAVVGFFGGFSLSGGGVGAALVAGMASPAAIVIGPAVLLGVIGLGLIHNYATFDCSAVLGCYPLECEFTRDLNNGLGMCHMKAPAHGLTNMPMWWMPPPGLKCAYRGHSIWYSAGCDLEACTQGENAKTDLGYFKSPKSKNDKLDLKNCQPLNIKDMSSHQQNKFLVKLREAREVVDAKKFIAKDPASKETKEFTRMGEMALHLTQYPVPECLTDASCRSGHTGFDIELNLQGRTEKMEPFCHKVMHKCFRPLVTRMEVEVTDEDHKNWALKFKKAVAWMLFRSKAQRGEELIYILQEDGTEFPGQTALMEIESNASSMLDEQVDAPGQNSWFRNWEEKTIQLVVKSTAAEGLSVVEAKQRLRDAFNDKTEFSGVGMQLQQVLGVKYAMRIKQAGAMCEPKERPAHATQNTCKVKAVNPGKGCSLECEPGWQAKNTAWCDDGEWSDEKALDEFTATPATFNTGSGSPVFECVDVSCPPKIFPDTCPRNFPGCFQWKDSKCDKGGLSGSDRDCDVVPAPGYMLASPTGTKWQCKADGHWHIPDDAEEPAMKEQKCKMPGYDEAVSRDLIDKDSGVGDVCAAGFTGPTSEDGPPGECKWNCLEGYVPDDSADSDPLRCVIDTEHASGMWSGKAKCRPATCQAMDLMAKKDDSIKGFDCRAEEVESTVLSEKRGDALCGVMCEEGFELVENKIGCGGDGEWYGVSSTTCAAPGTAKADAMKRRSFGRMSASSSPLVLLMICIVGSILSVSRF